MVSVHSLCAPVTLADHHAEGMCCQVIPSHAAREALSMQLNIVKQTGWLGRTVYRVRALRDICMGQEHSREMKQQI